MTLQELIDARTHSRVGRVATFGKNSLKVWRVEIIDMIINTVVKAKF